MENEIVEQRPIREYKYEKAVYLKCKDMIKQGSFLRRRQKIEAKQSYKGEETTERVSRDEMRILYVIYDHIRGKKKRVEKAKEQFGIMKTNKKEVKNFSPYIKASLLRLYDTVLLHVSNVAAWDKDKNMFEKYAHLIK